MVHHVSRTLSLVTFLIFMMSVQASALLDDPPIPQACDGTGVVYTVPGGSATGTGASAQRAKDDVGGNVVNIVLLSINPCAICPVAHECAGRIHFTWDNYVKGIPVWDPLLNVFTVSASWDGCTASQVCDDCD